MVAAPSRSLRAIGFVVLAFAALLPGAPCVAASGGCGQCDFLITGRDGDSYTATSGNTVCVDESAVFTGSITLKGGAFEVCGTAIPSSLSFPAGGEEGGRIVNHGTLRYFSLGLERVSVENHGVLLTYGNLVIGPAARLANAPGAFVGVGAELRNRGQLANSGVVDASGDIRNLGSFDNGGLVNAHRQLINGSELVNRGRINASEQFRNAEESTLESYGGTVATFDLLNEGLIFGDPGSGCNSLLVANRWRQPGKGELVGSLDHCSAGRADPPPEEVRSRSAKITSCGCFNP